MSEKRMHSSHIIGPVLGAIALVYFIPKYPILVPLIFGPIIIVGIIVGLLAIRKRRSG